MTGTGASGILILMKIWIKYLAGIVVGIAFALVAPHQNAAFSDTTRNLADLAIQFGRYALYPVVYISFTLGL